MFKMKESELNLYWNRFRIELFNYINSRINHEFDAEEILQDVFIKMYNNFDQLSDHSKLKAWLYKITKHAIIDYYRRRKESMIPLENVEHLLIKEEENNNMNDEIIACLMMFLDQLPDQYQQPVKMHDLKEKKHREISKELNMSLSGSKTRVQRGREKLKEILSDCCDIEFDAYGNVIDYTLLKKDTTCNK
jgi:RNA polymerase sigma-70 factor, ECF subfamily